MSVCRVTLDQKELDLTTPDMGCNLFLMIYGCASSGYSHVAHGTALIPKETQFSCRTLVACLPMTKHTLFTGPSMGHMRHSPAKPLCPPSHILLRDIAGL